MERRQREGLLYPDLLIAFDVDPAAAIARRGYSIEERGKPLEFVLEVASVNTARNDDTRKREGYAAYGIPEYWRFDPTAVNTIALRWPATAWLTANTSPLPSFKRTKADIGGTARR